jgi:acetate kinase
MAEGAILVLNSGSSSLKLSLIEPNSGEVLAHAVADRLHSNEPNLRFDAEPKTALRPNAGHADVLADLLERLDAKRIRAVGHRVVHGGEEFSESVLIDAGVIAKIRECAELAPLHNPANLQGIEAARTHFPSLSHVAVFDTAFHQSLPPKAYVYALPYDLYERHKVRRYGFHGTSHRYVAEQAARQLQRPLEELQLVTAHLGNGCSATAVKAGRSVDTSMGFTPLEGLVMGTRSGDLDPNLHLFLTERTGMSLRELTDVFTRQSGLLGLSGSSNDMRTLLSAAERGDARARLAIDVFTYRLAKTILGLSAALERLDALVFTGGIGENAAPVRADTLEQLRVLGAEVDPELNATHGAESGGRITHRSSGLLALVVPTNEELVIARETARLVPAARALHD